MEKNIEVEYIEKGGLLDHGKNEDVLFLDLKTHIIVLGFPGEWEDSAPLPKTVNTIERKKDKQKIIKKLKKKYKCGKEILFFQ